MCIIDKPEGDKSELGHFHQISVLHSPDYTITTEVDSYIMCSTHCSYTTHLTHWMELLGLGKSLQPIL